MVGVGMRRMKLGSQGMEVSAQGLGCMTMTGAHYGPSKPEAQMIGLLHHAVNSGVTFLDTSNVYGPLTNEILIGQALKQQQGGVGLRDKVQLATKFGGPIDGPLINEIFTGQALKQGGVGLTDKVQLGTKFGAPMDNHNMVVRGDPEYARECCEGSLERLQLDVIDLYYLHRIDTRIPIEITMGEMKKLVEEGKIKYVGLSEASASTIRRAHAVHPITAVQLEWSLWARDVEEEIVPTCRELGIGIVAYSPLGRGFLSSGAKLAETFQEDDFRKYLPRFQPENLEHNQKLFRRLNEIAEKKGCTTSQLALAWLHHQGDDVCPIPGTTKTENFNHNIGALLIKLTPQELAELESIASADGVKGERYPASFMAYTWKEADTPPMSSWVTS